MVKALFISLNLVGLAMLPFLYVGNVNVEHQAPSDVNAGESVEVTITINKGKVTGPARLKLDFSDAVGLVAEDIENAGSSFSFTDDNALFIWYSIQADEQVVLKYRVKAAANASGTKTISGSFSYLDEEERKKMDIPSVIIKVNGGSVATTTTPVETNTTNTTTTNTTTTTPTQNDEVSCSRNITQDGNDFIVSITVNKGSNHGFARIKETVPAGFTAESIENEGAVFKFVDNFAKYLWTALDADKSSVKVSYRLKRTSAAAGTYNVAGEFSGEFLIVNDVPKSVEIPKGTFTVAGEAVAITTDPIDTDPVDTDPVDTDPVTTISTSNSNISYKVQVLAGHKTVSNSYIKRHYGFSGGIAIENHEGWVKYTTGNFDIYKKARDKRNSLASYNFPGPFVTAYNKGERITVQEALMLSKQDWVK